MDSFARGLEVAHSLLTASPWEQWRADRYASFDNGPGRDFELAKLSLDDLRALAVKNGEPTQRSGKQERYENLINLHLSR
jgi:xylose isomerase